MHDLIITFIKIKIWSHYQLYNIWHELIVDRLHSLKIFITNIKSWNLIISEPIIFNHKHVLHTVNTSTRYRLLYYDRINKNDAVVRFKILITSQFYTMLLCTVIMAYAITAPKVKYYKLSLSKRGASNIYNSSAINN